MIAATARKRKRSVSQAVLGDVPEKQRHLDARELKAHGSRSHRNKRGKAEEILERHVSMSLPETSRYLPMALGGSHWHGRGSFENIIVIGDSYSKLNGSKTWVDHLESRLQKQHNPTNIHNFAFPGATAEDDLSNQLARFFATFPKKHSPSATPPLDPDKTTYFVFLGINDCGSTDSDELESIIETILDAAHSFYVKAGARNFVFMDVPPIGCSPQALDSGVSGEIEERVETWNTLLQAQIAEFSTSSKEATVFLFSLHQLLTEVLEDPAEFDFSRDDPTTEGGGIWDDDLHLTTEVHDILAERLLMSLTPSS